MNRQRARMKYRRRLSYFLLAVVVVATSVLVFRSRVYTVRELLISGNTVYADAQIASLSGIVLGESMFRVSEARVRQSLAANPHIEFVSLSLRFPSTVELAVRERVPRAVVNCAGVLYIIDEDGFILEKMNRMPDMDVILVSGMSVSVSGARERIEALLPGQFERMQAVLSALANQLLEQQISELNVGDLKNTYLVSKTGVQIILGDGERIAQKMTWAQAVLSDLTAQGITSGVLDVSTGENAVYADR